MSDLERAQEAFELFALSGYANHAGILELVEEGVDALAKNSSQSTLLHRAAECQHLNLCVMLIQQGAEIDAKDSWGKTPLHLAAWDALHHEVIKFLLEQGSDVHARNDGGETPLHEATKDAATFMLTYGANIWAKDNNDKTVLELDDREFIESHRDEWVPKLQAVLNGKFEAIKTTEDLYHLASVIKPADPKDIPHPKEFIRILFQQYLPHEPKFNAMYEEIFAQPRLSIADNLKELRSTARNKGVAL